MTTAKAIHLNSNSQHLESHLSGRPNTIVDADRYIGAAPTGGMTVVVYADLVIAFDATLKALADSNAYVVSEQGKQPDSVLEVAEYWRFDEMPIYCSPSRPDAGWTTASTGP